MGVGGGVCEILAAKGSLKGFTALELKSGKKEEKKSGCLLDQHKAFGARERERDGEEMGSDVRHFYFLL